MIVRMRWVTGLLLVTTFGLIAQAPPPSPATIAEPPPTESAIRLPGVDWHARAQKWFRTDDKEGRKEQMKAAGRTLERPCKYCHTKDFSGFTENKLITQEMMALSVENDVECGDCHAGRDLLTELGEKSGVMWEFAADQGAFCDRCHVPNTKFEKLTKNGVKSKKTWLRWAKRRNKTLHDKAHH